MKTSDEINHEKSSKRQRPDLVSPWFVTMAGDALGFGFTKHGGGQTGRGTYRDPGEQSLVETHRASFERHWNAWRRGELMDPDSGLPHLSCCCAQLSIIADLVGDPPYLGKTEGK